MSQTLLVRAQLAGVVLIASAAATPAEAIAARAARHKQVFASSQFDLRTLDNVSRQLEANDVDYAGMAIEGRHIVVFRHPGTHFAAEPKAAAAYDQLHALDSSIMFKSARLSARQNSDLLELVAKLRRRLLAEQIDVRQVGADSYTAPVDIDYIGGGHPSAKDFEALGAFQGSARFVSVTRGPVDLAVRRRFAPPKLAGPLVAKKGTRSADKPIPGWYGAAGLALVNPSDATTYYACSTNFSFQDTTTSTTKQYMFTADHCVSGRTPKTDPLGVRVVHRWVQAAA